MASVNCHYDCSEDRTHLPLLPYPDISGFGVSLAYTIIGSVAVALVLAYYFFEFRPDVFPYRDHDEETHSTFKMNPIDEAVLFWRLNRSSENTTRLRHSKQNALRQCMLIMSDFQLLTGISILISGFTQLRCGITAYHWQKIVKLAWFSCLTHLSCLTFLRDAFYKRTITQFWRIPGMVALVIMLIAAFIPTGQYIWRFGETSIPIWETNEQGPNPQSYAICSFFIPTRIEVDDFTRVEPDSLSTKSQMLEASRQRMVFSVVLLGFGMVQRLWRLYRSPTDAYLFCRHWCSARSRHLLWNVYHWTNEESIRACLLRVLLYRPMLAIHLSFRYLIDLITSTAFEVWWLFASFVYGALSLHYRDPKSHGDVDPGQDEWSYGQVIALVMLIAPIIALIEGYMSHIPERAPNSDAIHHPDQRILVPSVGRSTRRRLSISEPVPQVPDASFYHDLIAFPPLVYAGVMVTVSATFRIFTAVVNTSGQIRGIFEIPRKLPFMHHIPVVFSELCVCTLLCLAFERVLPGSFWKRVSFQIALFSVYSAMFQLPMWFEYATAPGKDPHAVLNDPDYVEQDYKPGRLQSFNFLWLMTFYLMVYLGISCADYRSRWRKGLLARNNDDPPRERDKEDIESQEVKSEKT